MRVLSLFDGISCGRVALERAGIKVTTYWASEIEEKPKEISNKNYPDIIQLGDVIKITKEMVGEIDLVCGGSPCQSFSNAGNRAGFDGKSGLFWEFARLVKELKPKYFLLENVKMKQEWQDIISEELGVKPIEINSNLVSGQNRKRLYWFGKRNDFLNKDNGEYIQIQVTQPEDKEIYLTDILEKEVDERYYLTESNIKTINRNFGTKGKIINLDEENSLIEKITYPSRINQKFGQIKCPTLTAAMGMGGGNVPVIVKDGRIRKFTEIECERLQTLPEIEKSCIIRICKDSQNNPVSAGNQNHKLQNAVGIVEKSNSKENVSSVEKNLNINNLQTKNAVEVDVLISCEESRIGIFSQGKLLKSVSGAKWKNSYLPLKNMDDFVQVIVGLNTIVEKITPFGEGESHQKSNLLVAKESGNNVVSIYGKEITQLAKDAKTDLITLKKLLKYTILDLSTQENKEQIIQTLFSCVVNAILGYIPKEIQNQNTLTFQIKSKVGYTAGVSSTHRYKAIGNGWTIDVIAHILSFIKYNG